MSAQPRPVNDPFPEPGTVLVLAGRRSGAPDPLAVGAGVSHKCLVPVLGEAMIGRVLRRVERAFPDTPVLVSIEDFAAIAAEPTVARLHAAGWLSYAPAQANLVDSVAAAAERATHPLLVTTADNVLVTTRAFHMLAEAATNDRADAILVLTREEDVRAAHAEGGGRFFKLRGGSYANCNLYWLSSDAALRAAEAFRGGGQFQKVRGRMLKAFGLLNALRFKLRLHTLDRMVALVSARMGVRIEALVLRDGRLAIDVDNERRLRVVEHILERSIS